METFAIIKETILALWRIVSFKRKRIHPSNFFSDSNRIDDISRDLVLDGKLNIDCVFVMLAHNGGKGLHPAALLFRTIVCGDFNSSKMKNFFRSNYINLALTYDYKLLLSDIYERRFMFEGAARSIHTESQTFRFKFLHENLQYARYFFIHHRKKEGMYYLMIGTTSQYETLDTPEHDQKIHFALNKITNIIKKYK